MTTVKTERTRPIKMVIGGSEVAIYFTVEPNPTVAELVKRVLLDSYLKKSSAYNG